MNQRIKYFDFLRGIAIAMVVAIHTYNVTSDIVSMTIRQITNCAVPLFLAISGYFLSKKDVSTLGAYKAFVVKSVPKVYIPCIIWSLPLFAMDIYRGKPVFTSVVILLICGYSIYYFVALIIQYYLLLPVLQKVNKSKACRIGSVLTSILSICFVTWLLHFMGFKIPLIAFAGPFPLWIMFFCLGIFIGKRDNRDYPIVSISILTVVSLVLMVLESRYFYALDGGGAGIKPSSFLFSFFAILLLFSRKAEKQFSRLGWFYKLFTYIGGLSFGIYLIHCYFVMVFTPLLQGTPLDFWPVKWLVILFITSFVVAIGKKILPWSDHYLGFR